jgi:16S rRNA (guanine966-N2)-methyltransferase
MRVVGGKHRGRRLAAPKGRALRPTSERAREALFDILEHAPLGEMRLQGACVRDLFAGTGALGLEALSRGAKRLVAIEKDPNARRYLRANARALGEDERTEIIPGDATRLPTAPEPFDYVFLDAPYGSGLSGAALATLAEKNWLAQGAVVTVELAVREEFDAPAGFTLLDERRYGRTRFVILRYDAGKV